jgi:hypothetical protein
LVDQAGNDCLVSDEAKKFSITHTRWRVRLDVANSSSSVANDVEEDIDGFDGIFGVDKDVVQTSVAQC